MDQFYRVTPDTELLTDLLDAYRNGNPSATPAQTALRITLHSHPDKDEYGYVKIGKSDLASRVGISKKTLMNLIDTLAESGELDISQHRCYRPVSDREWDDRVAARDAELEAEATEEPQPPLAAYYPC